MILLKQIKTKVLLLCFSIVSYVSYCQFNNNLNEAFNKAKTTSKVLLIYGNDQKEVDYYNNTSMTSNSSQVEEFIKSSNTILNIKENYVFYKLDVRRPHASLEKELLDSLIFTYPPCIILFDENNNLLHSFTLYEDSLYNFENRIKDTINVKRKLLVQRQKLEAVFNNNSITNEELISLISIRDQIGLKTRNHLNELGKRNPEISNEILQIINHNNLKTSDRIITYISEYEKPVDYEWNYFRAQVIEGIKENAVENLDQNEFEKAQLLKAHFGKVALKSIEEENIKLPLFDFKKNKNALDENLATEYFNFYSAVSNKEKIVIFGELLADLMVKDFKEKKSEYLKSEGLMLYFATPLNEVVSEEEKEKRKNSFMMSKARSYDEGTSNQLNNIAWAYYEKIDSKTHLKKAVGWSKKSIDLYRSPENLDTFAHLLFKLKKVKKAIEVEEQALLLAKEANKTQYVHKFSEALQNFKIRRK